MSDLVERLRSYGERTVYEMQEDREEAADTIEELLGNIMAEQMSHGVSLSRIEQLERELAESDKEHEILRRAAIRSISELAAEKALADNLWAMLGYFGALRNRCFEQSDIAAAYRKARGL